MAKQFGIVTTATGVSSIVVTSFSETSNVEIAEARDGQGKVTDMQAYSRNKTVAIKGFLDGSTIVEAGSVLTLNGVSYIVESVTRNETNTGFVEVDISAKSADSATVTAYNTSTVVPD